MSVDEVVAGLDYCLHEGKCVDCVYDDHNMPFVSCTTLVEEALKYLRIQHKAIMDLKELLRQENEHNRKLMDEITNILLKKH